MVSAWWGHLSHFQYQSFVAKAVVIQGWACDIRCDIEWVPHSPDLPPPPPPDIYLRGYLKDQVYENNTQTVDDLKTAITAGSGQSP